jgi:hypothetical protein
MLVDAEKKAIDNWRFNTRMPTRAAAVRELMRRGLKAEGGRASQSYEVVRSPLNK